VCVYHNYIRTEIQIVNFSSLLYIRTYTYTRTYTHTHAHTHIHSHTRTHTHTHTQCKLITDDALIALAKGCKRLETLQIGFCRKLSDNGFRALIHRKELKTTHAHTPKNTRTHTHTHTHNGMHSKIDFKHNSNKKDTQDTKTKGKQSLQSSPLTRTLANRQREQENKHLTNLHVEV